MSSRRLCSRTGGHGRSEIKHGPPLSAETARRIACDAAIIELESDTYAKPLNIDRKTRWEKDGFPVNAENIGVILQIRSRVSIVSIDR